MTKRLLYLLFVSTMYIPASVLAQIPNGYYDSAQGLTGDPLKAALHNIIKGHTTYPYTSSSTDVWDILKAADKDPNNSNNVIGIYSRFSMDGPAEYASGSGWSREHVWAKSRGNFGTSQGAGTDCHHIVAEDVSTNSARNNRNFDEAPDAYTDGSGTYSGPTPAFTSDVDWIWEPPAEVKGDVARMIFYMATRYEGDSGEPDLELIDGYLDASSQAPQHGKLSTLLAWHQADPVSDAERDRNDVIYSYQNNRNPFIDHPEYVCLIYTCSGGGNNAPQFSSTAVTSATENQSYTYNITATDADAGATLTITAPTKPSWLTLTDNGNGTATLSGTPSSANVGANAVTLTVSDGTDATNQSFTITVSSAGGGGGTISDLIISEYIEGSSNNKAIEIANFTGSDVNLSNYTLHKQTNGAGSWSGGLSLSGTLTNGSVYIVAHSSASSTITSVANYTGGNSELTFNGNDPVALFKSGTLIDIIGTFNGGSGNFAQNTTLRRKDNVTSPNATYTTSEWDTYATDTFDGLGSHTVTGGADTQAPSNPTSLSAAGTTETSTNLSWSASTDNVGVTGYDVYRGGSLIGSTASTSYSVTGLTAATSYAFNVRAKDAAGNVSGNSNTANVTTLTPPDTQAPSNPSSLSASGTTENSTNLSWSASTDNVGVTGYDVYQDGSLLGSSVSTSFSVTGLTASTAYAYTVRAKDAAGNVSGNSNTANVTTLDPPGSGPISDLIISEYIEGSSNNKAIEIANYTGASVNLANYTLHKQTNGAGSWSGGLTLSGTLADGAVYIVANSSASSAITSTANYTGGNSELTFNGNDPVALFKSGSLIDIIGTFNGGSGYFAQNTTLRRKGTVTSPNATYTISEWDSFAQDTFDGLGSHSVGAPDTEAPSNPSSLNGSGTTETSTNLSWTASTDNVGVTEYDVYRDGSLIGSTSNTSYSVSGLSVATSYAFTVRAKDAAGNVSGNSNTANVTTPDTTAPSAPTLSASNETTSTVDLSWSGASDNVGVSGYDVYQDGSLLGFTSGSTYNVTGLSASTSYTFNVRAKDAAGNVSGNSNTANVTTSSAGGSSVTLMENYFESGWDGWTDGGSDCYRYSGSRSWEGSYSIRIRDNSGTASAMTSGSHDVSNYNQIDIEFYFYSYSMENGEDFWVRYYDGSSWNTVATYARGTSFENNNFYSANITITDASYNFPSNAQFRFQCDASGNADHIYIDQVTITASNSTARSGKGTKSNVTLVAENISENSLLLEEENGFFSKIYPNPATSYTNIEVNLEEASDLQIKVYNLQGREVYSANELNVNGLFKTQIDVSNFKQGLYIVSIVGSDFNDVKKIIVR